MASQPITAVRSPSWSRIGFDHGVFLLIGSGISYWQQMPVLAGALVGAGGLVAGVAVWQALRAWGRPQRLAARGASAESLSPSSRS